MFSLRVLSQPSACIHNLTTLPFCVASIRTQRSIQIMPKAAQKKKAASSSSDSDSGPDDRTPVKKAKPDVSTSATKKTDSDEKCWELDKNKRATVRSFKGKTFLDIREFYLSGGNWMPGKKGITLQLPQFRKLLENADEITKELESK